MYGFAICPPFTPGRPQLFLCFSDFCNLYNEINTFKFLFHLRDSDRRFCDFSKKKWKYNSPSDYKGEVITDILFYDLNTYKVIVK